MAPFLPLAPNRFRWYFPFGSLFRLWQKLSKEGRLVALLHATASMNQAIASQQLVKRLTRCAEQGPSNCQVSRNLSRWSMTWRRTTQTLHHLIFRFVSLSQRCGNQTELDWLLVWPGAFPSWDAGSLEEAQWEVQSAWHQEGFRSTRRCDKILILLDPISPSRFSTLVPLNMFQNEVPWSMGFTVIYRPWNMG